MNLNNFEGGLYLHIPFCKKACKYCNFHFTTSLAHKPNLLAALSKEIELSGKLFSTKKLQTIYFGGGTPSLLNADEINHLFEIIGENYDLSEVTEITMEANPDDLTEAYLIALKDTPINRLSIGVQSFHADDLAWMGRVHDVRQAMECIPLAYKH
ncbi:MAG: radical SAM protein [Saprospiraceae bacterium]|nr:radical SAM protein [Candidatus Brachybacter algidus]